MSEDQRPEVPIDQHEGYSVDQASNSNKYHFYMTLVGVHACEGNRLDHQR